MKEKIIKCVGPLLCVLTLIVGMIFPSIVSKAAEGIEYYGKINYMGTIVGHFNINGQMAFCFEHEKPTPSTGTAFGDEIYNDANLQKVLYYGWDGADPWSGFGSFEQGVVLTSLAGSYYYSGAGSIGFAFGGNYSNSIGFTQFIQYIESQTMPALELMLSKQDLESYVEAGVQRTETIYFDADSRNTITIPLSNDVTLYNVTTGAVTKGSTAIKGGDTFYLSAPINKNGMWNSGNMAGSIKKLNAVLAKTSPAVQDLGHYNWATDPTSTVQLNVNWKGLGKIKLQKVDSETDKNAAQGNGSLVGAIYEIMDGTTVVDTLITDENGQAESKEIPMKEYVVKEKTASKGYLVDVTSHSVNLNALEVEMQSKEQMIRGDLEFVKIEDGTGKHMANIPFKITSKTTGENHTVVSDKNGCVNTESSWNPHQNNTNRGETYDDGIWFGDISALKEDVGALPYDTYMIEELRCDANAGKILLAGIEVVIERNKTTINLGTFTNDAEPIPVIGTKAMDKESGSKQAIAKNSVTIVDTVSYQNLVVGKEYLLKGWEMVKGTDGKGTELIVNGKKVANELKFTPTTANGEITIEFTFDASALAGKSVVTYEELYDNTNPSQPTIVAEHKDITNTNQTVGIVKVPVTPSTPTTVKNVQTGDRVSIAVIGMIAFGILGLMASVSLFFTTRKRKAKR